MALFGQLTDALDASRLVDVGANVGLYSFRFVARRPRGHVLALEPDPANVICLARTIRRSNLSSVDVRAIAAGDHKGQAVFQFDDVAGMTGQLKSDIASFVQRHCGVRPREGLVAVDTLDAIVGDSRPDIVKIDVEGAEAKVLRGARHLLDDVRPCLLIELGKGREASTDLPHDAGYALYDARAIGPLVANSWNVLGLPGDQAAIIIAQLARCRDSVAAPPHH